MSRRLVSLLLSLLLVLLFVLVDIVGNIVDPGGLRRWALPLLGGTVFLLAAGTVWQYLVEHPAPPRRVWTAERPPYPGLEAFTEQDAGVFFGRDSQIAELVDRLHPLLPRASHRFVAVVGPSGSGKSSLVQAGLLPRLAARRNRWVVIGPLLPGPHPMRGLAASLGVGEAELAQALRAAGGGRSNSMLVVIDQAEELLTLTSATERTAFLSLLREALAADPRLWVVATLRSEFLTGFLEDGFADLFTQPIAVGTLDRAALSAVIEGPAAQAGLAFAPGLVQRLVDDTGGGDALPLLAYTLQALYLRVGSGGTATIQEYEQLGGVAGTLSRQADRVTAELSAADPDAPVVTTLLRFVTLDGAEPTRRRVQRNALDDAEGAVVDAFVAARLLTSDASTVHVAHEALLRQWPPLAQAIEARADELRERAALERWAADSQRSGHRDSYLLTGDRLATARQWAAAHADLATDLPLVRDLLDRSMRADHAAMERLSETIARQALAEVERHPEHSLALALATIEECAPTLLARQALVAALMASRVRAVLHGHADSVYGVAWSPDGRRLATASRDRTARIWDAASGEEQFVLRGHQDAVQRVAWSPDGQRLATTSDDCTTRLWDTSRGEEQLVLHGHSGSVWGVAWSPDGRRLATASHDVTARTWDATHGGKLLILHGHSDAVHDVAWSPDGTRVATTSQDRTARVWDASHGNELLVLHHGDWVWGVAWSPDGRHVATTSQDHGVRLWDTARGQGRFILHGHEDSVRGVAWSPDGTRVATTSGDRTSRLWDVSQGKSMGVLHGHSDSVYGVSWSADGQRLATTSHDHSAHIWDATHGEELLVLHGHQAGLIGVTWSPDSKRVATVSRDCTARIWDATHGDELLILRHGDWVWGVAWSPDGQRLATSCNDRTARIWDTTCGDELLALHGHEAGLIGVAWSPDSQRLATTSHDRTTWIWDTTCGEKQLVLDGHKESVWGVAWSPDGQRLATTSHDHTARVWDANHGSELISFGHEAGLMDAAWSPDGERLATASRDGSARIWDLRRGTELAIYMHTDWVTGVAWSPDGTGLATASRDRTARIWDAAIDLDALVAKARTRVFLELTEEERRRLMLPDRTESG